MKVLSTASIEERILMTVVPIFTLKVNKWMKWNETVSELENVVTYKNDQHLDLDDNILLRWDEID